MQEPFRVKRYDTYVWETPMDSKRREECMCLHCGHMNPGLPNHCKTAAAFYEICKKSNVAFIVTRCEAWKPDNRIQNLLLTLLKEAGGEMTSDELVKAAGEVVPDIDPNDLYDEVWRLIGVQTTRDISIKLP